MLFGYEDNIFHIAVFLPHINHKNYTLSCDHKNEEANVCNFSLLDL